MLLRSSANMMFWSPVQDKVEEWQPTGGWNASYSEQDKIQAAHLFFFFKNKKGYSNRKSEILCQMVVFKNKYKGLEYSREQEGHIREALQTVFSS
jgi:hypothetical protein